MAMSCGGLSFQPIGVGTNKWGTDPQKFDQTKIRGAFETSLAQGVTLLNTAQLYGTSEDCIGKLRAEVEGGQKMLVISKFDALSQKTEQLIPSLKESIRKCGVETMDGFLIHHPKGNAEALADQLATAHQQGLLRAAGVSNYDERALRQMHGLLKERGVPLAFNEVEFSLLRRLPESNGLLKACEELGVTILAWAPLASGRLTSKPCTEHFGETATVQCLAAVRTLAEKHKKTPAQVALNWCICKGVVPIPGARTAEQAQENAGALGWQLSQEEVAQLDAVAVDSMGMYHSPEAIYTFFGFWPPSLLRPLCSAFLRCTLAVARRCLPLQDE